MPSILNELQPRVAQERVHRYPPFDRYGAILSAPGEERRHIGLTKYTVELEGAAAVKWEIDNDADHTEI